MSGLYAVPPREVISAPVLGAQTRFPIRRIFCVARNYAAHAREMGMDEREAPFFFCKDADAYAPAGAVVPYPLNTADYQHEIELVVAIGKAAANVTPETAASHIFGYAIGLDMTRRDIQAAARQKGRPWCEAKNFPGSAPMSAITPIQMSEEMVKGGISLKVNGAIRQTSDIAMMLWNVNEIIAHLSASYRLESGDLIFTGTPEGVAPVLPDDILVGGIDGLGELTVKIGQPSF